MRPTSDQEIRERMAALRREPDDPEDDGAAIDYMIQHDGSTPRAAIDAQLAEWGYAPASIHEMWSGIEEGYRDAAEKGAVKSFGAQFPTDPVVVFSYPGRTQKDAAALFAKDASHLEPQGYRPISQSWGEGRPGVARVLLYGPLASLAFRPKGFLTVTYEREVPDAPAQKTTGDLAERLQKLDEARHLGLMTEEEHAAQRQRILDSA